MLEVKIIKSARSSEMHRSCMSGILRGIRNQTFPHSSCRLAFLATAFSDAVLRTPSIPTCTRRWRQMPETISLSYLAIIQANSFFRGGPSKETGVSSSARLGKRQFPNRSCRRISYKVV